MHARTLVAMLLVGCSSSSGPGASDAAANDVTPIVDASEEESAVDAGARAAYGEPCALADAGCADGLFCLEGPSGGAIGFCTKTCPSTSSAACPGAPAGTAAYCVVTDVDPQGDKGCAFLCRVGSQTYTCPGALKCQTTEDPPGSGQYLCLP